MTSDLQSRLEAMLRSAPITQASREKGVNYAVALNLLRQLDERDARTCEWTYDESEDSWNGTCGIKWVLTEGTPEENEMHFCPGCGAALKGGQP